LGADGRAGGIYALREEAENPPALRTGEFIDRHWNLRFIGNSPVLPEVVDYDTLSQSAPEASLMRERELQPGSP